MAKHYLEFEKPIQEFEDKIIKLQSLEGDDSNPLELNKLIERTADTQKLVGENFYHPKMNFCFPM